MGSVVIVVMDPPAQRVSPLLLGQVVTGVGPPVSHGVVEPLNLAVCLRAVGPGPLPCDPQLPAGLNP